MKALSSLVIAYAIAASIFVGIGKAQDEVPLFSIKSGETLPLRVVTIVTATCDPLYLGFEGIDVMEGPQELSLKFEPGMVRTFASTRDCPKPVNWRNRHGYGKRCYRAERGLAHVSGPHEDEARAACEDMALSRTALSHGRTHYGLQAMIFARSLEG